MPSRAGSSVQRRPFVSWSRTTLGVRLCVASIALKMFHVKHSVSRVVTLRVTRSPSRRATNRPQCTRVLLPVTPVQPVTPAQPSPLFFPSSPTPSPNSSSPGYPTLPLSLSRLPSFRCLHSSLSHFSILLFLPPALYLQLPAYRLPLPTSRPPFPLVSLPWCVFLDTFRKTHPGKCTQGGAGRHARRQAVAQSGRRANRREGLAQKGRPSPIVRQTVGGRYCIRNNYKLSYRNYRYICIETSNDRKGCPTCAFVVSYDMLKFTAMLQLRAAGPSSQHEVRRREHGQRHSI